jgi:hypothetical protein
LISSEIHKTIAHAQVITIPIPIISRVETGDLNAYGFVTSTLVTLALGIEWLLDELDELDDLWFME